MTNSIRSNFQDHPFHLVSPSPWPLYTSISLFTLTVNGALSMHLFNNSYIVFYIALATVITSMTLWFRDIIAEGKKVISHYNLNISSVISKEEVNKALIKYKNTNDIYVFSNKNNLAYYLAGLLEGDGHISLPSLGVTNLNRVLNPRIVFTSHKDNLGMYAFLQSELNNIGRFQYSNENTIRYIIGDMKSIIYIINMLHNKFRTPKNIRFNNLITFMNNKYSLGIKKSLLDTSNLGENAWLTGFTEADGHFGIKYIEKKEKYESLHRKRSVSESVSLKFRLDQRAFDKPTLTSMKPFMESLALFLSCSSLRTKTYKTKNETEILSLYISSIKDLEFIVNYFNKYPLIGNKLNDFKTWKTVFYMIKSKQHLSEEGRLKIKVLMNKL